MIYILERKLNINKSIFYGLNEVYGLGQKTSFKICKALGFTQNLKIKELSKSQTKNLLIYVNNLTIKINDDLKQLKIVSLQNSISIKTYRGLRKIRGFPVRGQRTKTNAKTAKK